MANKKTTNIPLFGDIGNSFEETRDFLNYKPRIEFVEPNPEIPEEDLNNRREEEKSASIKDVRQRVEDLINNLESVAKLANLTQERIDNRVKNGGGVTIRLDPIKDMVTVAAMKRRFPDKADPTQITYDDYRKAIDCMCKNGIDNLAESQRKAKNLNNTSGDISGINSKDLSDALSDLDRVNFGGSDNQSGENRAEISSPLSTIKPVDLDQYQKAGVLAVFGLMQPLITKLAIKIFTKMMNPF